MFGEEIEFKTYFREYFAYFFDHAEEFIALREAFYASPKIYMRDGGGLCLFPRKGHPEKVYLDFGDLVELYANGVIGKRTSFCLKSWRVSTACVITPGTGKRGNTKRTRAVFPILRHCANRRRGSLTAGRIGCGKNPSFPAKRALR